MEEIRGYKHNPEMKNDEDFKEYESLVMRENNTDKEYKRIGELANKLIDKYGSLPGGETVRRGEVRYEEEPKSEGSKKKRIRATDNPDWVWDDENTAKRFMATPYLYGNFSKDMSDEDKADLKENYKAYKKMSLDDFMKSKDFQPFYEYVGDDEEVETNNPTSKSLWGEDEKNQYVDLDKLLDEWDAEEIDTNDNGKIEEDELDAYTKDLEDYLEKNPNAKKKNYY